MATENTLRYIKLDYQSHRDALLQRIRDRYPGVWNDFLANSIGVVLVELVAWGLATLAFMINRIGAENFIGTMTLRESAVRVGRLVGYQLRGPVPSTVSCEATISAAQSATVTIKKGTLIRTSDAAGLPFEVTSDFNIVAGDLTPQTLVVSFSPSESGSKVLNTSVSVVNGSTTVDIVDSTIDLSQYLAAGQSFKRTGDTVTYSIASIEKAPGGVSDYNRLVLTSAYAGTTGITTATVYDQRISLVQGQSVTEQFIASNSDTSSFSVLLTQTPVIFGSVVVTVNGENWSQVDELGLAASDEKVFQVRTYASGSTVVLFGDGDFGEALPASAVIIALYRVGGGTAGNIELNTINTSISGFIESFNSPVSVQISNSTATGIGGQDAETLDQARVNIPSYTKAHDQAVTLSDYQTIAQQYASATAGSVAFARAMPKTENSFLEGNIVAVYAWTTGPSGGLVPLSSALKQSLQDYMQTKCVGTDLVQVYDGTSRPVPVSLRFKTFSGFSVSDTQRLLSDTIRSHINSLRPGDPVLFSNFVRELDSVYGVDTLIMATPTGDLRPSLNTELFTAPQDSYVYTITRTGDGVLATDDLSASVGQYKAQLPIYPLAAWSIRLFLGDNELTVLPYHIAGYARLLGENLSASDNVTYHSTVNLLTGQATLWLKGTPGDLTLKLVSITGYSTEHTLNTYIGYSGDNSQTKRREVRAMLRAWSDNLSVGSTVYARRVAGISASKSSISDVVAEISGITAVNRVALVTPASTESRVAASSTELLRLGTIVINNELD